MKRLLDTNTRFFDQNSFNTPKMTNKWGAMIDVLDFALVNGSLPQEVLYTSLEEEEFYWLYKLTLNSNHGFKKHLSVVNISESSEIKLNGLHRIQEVVGDTVTVALDKKTVKDRPSDILETLGMLIKLEPLGYSKAFEGFQKAVYKSSDTTAKEAFLRVDNSCPETNYDPSWAKFSRVSMFSEIDDIDDYQFRLGRLKDPCWGDNYNAAEDNRSDVWFNTRSAQHAHSFPVDYTNTLRDVNEFYIIGDSKTFYIFIKEILLHTPTVLSDAIYCFGEFTKYMFKEDPHPFLLQTAVKYDNTNYHFHSPSTHFSKDTVSGKYIFNSDFNYNFTSQTHQNWVFWLNESFLSGQNTRINFKMFKNELAYNLFPKNIKTHRQDVIIMEGCLRGIYDFMCNLMDTPEYAPLHLEIIEVDTLYLTTNARDYSMQNIKYAFKLSNWE